MALDLLLLLLLTGINGFFALSEIALVTSRLHTLEEMQRQGLWGAKAAQKLVKTPEFSLSTIQVGITLVVLGMGVFSGVQVSENLQPLLLNAGLPEEISQPVSLVLTLAFITYVSIVLGELLPKTIALSHPEHFACRTAPFLYVMSYVFFPFVKLLTVSTKALARLMNLREQHSLLSSSELRYMVRKASEKGIIEGEQKLLHEKVFYFADKYAKHLMTHKEQLDWVDILQPPEEIHKQILRFRHSKVICVRGDLSHVEGIIKQREYLKAYLSDKNFQLSHFIKKAVFLDHELRAEKVLQRMRREGTGVCLVTQSHSKEIVGLISLTDIFTSLVGQMASENMPYEPPIFEKGDGSFLLSGDAPVELLEELVPGFSIDFGQVAYSSIGGFVYYQLSKQPQIGDRVHLQNRIIEIVDMDGKIIDKLLLSAPEKT